MKPAPSQQTLLPGGERWPGEFLPGSHLRAPAEFKLSANISAAAERSNFCKAAARRRRGRGGVQPHAVRKKTVESA